MNSWPRQMKRFQAVTKLIVESLYSSSRCFSSWLAGTRRASKGPSRMVNKMSANQSVERTSKSSLRSLLAAAHLQRAPSGFNSNKSTRRARHEQPIQRDRVHTPLFA